MHALLKSLTPRKKTNPRETEKKELDGQETLLKKNKSRIILFPAPSRTIKTTINTLRGLFKSKPSPAHLEQGIHKIKLKSTAIFLLKETGLDYCQGDTMNSFDSPEAFKSFFGSTVLKRAILVLETNTFTYTLDTLPVLPFLDRYAVARRRLEKFMPKAFFKGYKLLSKKNLGLGGLENSPNLEKWIETFVELRIPIQRVTATPLELTSLLPKSAWALVLYQNTEGTIRHSFLNEGNLMFTRITSSLTNLLADMDSTFQYATRFKLADTTGQIIQLGALPLSLPDQLRGIPIKRLKSCHPFEHIFLYSKTYHSTFRFCFNLSKSPLRKNRQLFLWPYWIKRLSLTYVLGGVALSGYLFVQGTLQNSQGQKIQQKAVSNGAHLSYFTKSAPDLLKKVTLLKMYEKTLTECSNPLVFLRKIASHKPKNLVANYLMWCKKENSLDTLTLTVGSTSSILPQEKFQQKLTGFSNELRKVFPYYTIENQNKTLGTTQTLLSREDAKESPKTKPSDQTLIFKKISEKKESQS